MTDRNEHTDIWPFEDWLRLAVTRFGLTPAAFWTMSLRDWLVLTRQTAIAPLTRETFDAMQIQYPDSASMSEPLLGDIDAHAR